MKGKGKKEREEERLATLDAGAGRRRRRPAATAAPEEWLGSGDGGARRGPPESPHKERREGLDRDQ